MKPFISTKFYGVINYLLALTMIASPWLFHFADVSSAALLMPIYMGWIQLIMAIFVNNETGLVKQFPMQIHLILDVMMGFILMVSPWLYAYASYPNEPRLPPQFVFGFLLMFMGFFTKKSPFTSPGHKSLHQVGSITSTDSL